MPSPTGRTFKKGDRVKRSNEWLRTTWSVGGFGQQSRQQCLGTVASTPRQDDTVFITWDGRKAPDQWMQFYVEHT